MTDELYLILHKVRGEPAFDIATQIVTEDGETLWIIPTSGHRAHPVWSVELNMTDDGALYINQGMVAGVVFELPPIPDDWPDHYRTSRSTSPSKPSSTLLAALGLVKPQPPIRRI